MCMWMSCAHTGRKWHVCLFVVLALFLLLLVGGWMFTHDIVVDDMHTETTSGLIAGNGRKLRVCFLLWETG